MLVIDRGCSGTHYTLLTLSFSGCFSSRFSYVSDDVSLFYIFTEYISILLVRRQYLFCGLLHRHIRVNQVTELFQPPRCNPEDSLTKSKILLFHVAEIKDTFSSVLFHLLQNTCKRLTKNHETSILCNFRKGQRII